MAFTFDGDGLEVERRFNTGVAQQTAYDADRRLNEVNALSPTGTTIEHLKWSYDASGNVTAIDDLRPKISPADDRSETYRYDNLYRLRQAEGAWGKTTWAYSPSGNLTRRVSDVAGQTVTKVGYGEAAGPHAATSLDARRLAYDALGRLEDDGDRVYTWNSVDQLIAVQNANGDLAENQFDGEGVRRVRREATARGKTSTTYFISDWEEVRDDKLVRYIVHADRRIVRLADMNGGVASAGKSSPIPSTPLCLMSLLSGGQFAILAVLLLVFALRARPVVQAGLRGVPRSSALFAAGLTLIACSGDAAKRGGHATDAPHGSVQTLGDDDTILIHDQLGSVLAEASGGGKLGGRFASYAFGLTRYSTTSETRLYAGHPRDRGVGLDLMGARFYAPDLGIWTAADPGLLNSPERGAGADFGAVNAYAYSNLNPIGARDPNGEFLQIVAGFAVGALLGGGFEAARQYISTGKVEDWGRVGAAAVGGAIAGAVTAAVPTAGYFAVMGMGAVSGAAGGAATRLVESGGKSAGTALEIVSDSVIGALTAGAVKGGGSVVSKAARAVAPKAARALSRISALTSEKVFQKQYKHLDKLAEARAARDALAESVGRNSKARPAAVAGGYNTETGQVAARGCGSGLCAEDHVVNALGGDRTKVNLTEAVRPRNRPAPYDPVPVCETCEHIHTRDAFPSGTLFKSDQK